MIKTKLIIFMPTIDYGGGVEKNFFIITNFLSTKFKNVTIITLSNSAKTKLNNKVKIVCPEINLIKYFGRRTKFLISLIYLFKEIINNKNCTVLCFQGIMYCILLCKLLRTKIIIRSNSSPSGWSKNFIKNIFYKKIYGFADNIIVNSLNFKKELQDKFNLKSTCIYNPLNISEIVRLSKKKIKINFFEKKSLNIISVARFSNQKDHECLIKSIKNINKFYNVKLILLGSGPLKNQLLKLIKKLRLSKNIKIINFKINPYPYINKSDIFILSSKYEGLPNVLLEAISLKKFVISSDCPTGPREILDNGKGGELFKTGKHKLLSKKIIFYINNKKKLKSKSIYAFKRLSRFNYNERLKDYFNLINN